MPSRRQATDLLSILAIVAAAVASVIGLTIRDTVRAPIQFRADVHGINLTTLVVVMPLFALVTVLCMRGSSRARVIPVGVLSWLLWAYTTLMTGTQIGTLSILYVVVFGASLAALIMSIGISLTETAVGEAMRIPLAIALALCFLFVLGITLLDAVRPGDETIRLALFGLATLLVWKRAALGAIVSSIAVVMTGLFGTSEIARILYLWQKGVPPTWIALAVSSILILTAIGCGAILTRALSGARSTRETA
jgi:hypothetical protein